jgi:DNA-binding SARP family transcriptional activator
MAPAERDVPDGRLTATLLGRFSIRTSGRTDEVRLPHKAQQLLAYLLLHRRREHHRETLAETLWTARNGDARKQLRQTLWILQGHFEGRIPGGRLVDQGGEWIALAHDADVAVDLWNFEEETQSLIGSGSPLREAAALRRAVAAERLYPGHFLAGWTEPWCGEPREGALRL